MSGAFELLEDHVAHARAGVDERGRDDRQRMLWKVTSKAKRLLESNLLDNDRTLQFRSQN